MKFIIFQHNWLQHTFRTRRFYVRLRFSGNDCRGSVDCLARNIRYEEDLVDQLFNSSEKRLARVLLLLAHFGKDGKHETLEIRTAALPHTSSERHASGDSEFGRLPRAGDRLRRR